MSNYAGVANKLESSSIPVDTGGVDYTVREPYGVNVQIVPWNFSANLFARDVAPALVAGNTTGRETGGTDAAVGAPAHGALY